MPRKPKTIVSELLTEDKDLLREAMREGLREVLGAQMTDVSVRSSSRATWLRDFPLPSISRQTSSLYSLLKYLRFLAMGSPLRGFLASSSVSLKHGARIAGLQ